MWGPLIATMIGLTILVGLWLAWFFRPELLGLVRQHWARLTPALSTFSTEQTTIAAIESRSSAPESPAPIMSNARVYRYDRRHAARMHAHIHAHIHARKHREAGKPEAGSQREALDHLYVSDKGLSKGQIGELEAWVRSGKEGFTQERWSVVMAKRPKTIGEAVRAIEAKIVQEQKPAAPVPQAVVKPVQTTQPEPEQETALERFEPIPGAPAPEPYMSPDTFMRKLEQHAA